MTNLEIILIIAFALMLINFAGIFAFYICKTRIQLKSEIVKGYRELWTFYHNNYQELKDIFVNSKDSINEKQSMFLVMLFNQMELVYNTKRYDLLPRTFDFSDDFKEIMTYEKVKSFWKANRIYRDKAFAKYIDKILLTD